jgi:hypothetical protein
MQGRTQLEEKLQQDTLYSKRSANFTLQRLIPVDHDGDARLYFCNLYSNRF